MREFIRNYFCTFDQLNSLWIYLHMWSCICWLFQRVGVASSQSSLVFIHCNCFSLLPSRNGFIIDYLLIFTLIMNYDFDNKNLSFANLWLIDEWWWWSISIRLLYVYDVDHNLSIIIGRATHSIVRSIKFTVLTSPQIHRNWFSAPTKMTTDRPRQPATTDTVWCKCENIAI